MTPERSREGSAAYPFEFDPAGDEPVCRAIVAAIADVEGVPPRELDHVSRYVDPDSLDDLLTSADEGVPTSARVEFEFPNAEVVVESDGTILVTPLQHA
jgi:hypothetical protein